jgi:hypothetical protein
MSETPSLYFQAIFHHPLVFVWSIGSVVLAFFLLLMLIPFLLDFPHMWDTKQVENAEEIEEIQLSDFVNKEKAI